MVRLSSNGKNLCTPGNAISHHGIDESDSEDPTIWHESAETGNNIRVTDGISAWALGFPFFENSL